MRITRCPYRNRPGVLLDHLEGVLREGDEERLREHVSGCDRCAGELRAYAEILALARSEPAPEADEAAGERIRRGLRVRLTREAEESREHRVLWRRWQPLALGSAAVAVLALFVMRASDQAFFATHEGAPSGRRPASGAEGSTASTQALETASTTQLDAAIASYESDRIAENGPDAAFDELTPQEKTALAEMLDEELQSLLAKHRPIQDHSSLAPELEVGSYVRST